MAGLDRLNIEWIGETLAGDVTDMGNLLTRPNLVKGPHTAPSPLSSLRCSNRRTLAAEQHVVPIVTGSFRRTGDNPPPFTGIGFTGTLFSEPTASIIVDEQVRAGGIPLNGETPGYVKSVLAFWGAM